MGIFSKASHCPETTFFGHIISGTLGCGLDGLLEDEEHEAAEERADLIRIEFAIIIWERMIFPLLLAETIFSVSSTGAA